MKNKKGFTLIELLATLVILSVIMLVAVPNTMSMLDKNKKESIISDAKRFVALAESEIRNNDKIDTSYGGFIVFRLEDLNDGSFDKDPDGKPYDQKKSFVAVHKNGDAQNYQFDYYVQMYGEKKGIVLANSKSLSRDLVVGDLPTKDDKTTIGQATGLSSSSVTIDYYTDLNKIDESVENPVPDADGENQ